MKVGLLMTDGTILPRDNITHAMESFVRMKRTQAEFGFGPVRIMQSRFGQWAPLSPDSQQMKKCMQAIASVSAYMQESSTAAESRGRKDTQ